MSKFLYLLALGLGLSACSMLQRTDNSGYAAEEPSAFQSVEEFYRARALENWNKAKDELGMTQNLELAENEIQSIRHRVQLSQLESQLQYKEEKKQYYGYKPYFRTDAERLYFLSLPNPEARERWVQARGIASLGSRFDNQTINMIENNDVMKGMTKKAVEQSWGEPDAVEHAGDPMYGNERWRYKKLVSTQDGYQNEIRIIYFEAGRVAGWETTQ
jgi:hypothetical protein